MVDKLADRVSIEKAKKIGYTLAKVKYQAVVNKMSVASRGNI